MRKLFLLPFVLFGCSVLSPLQKSKLLTLSNLIETSKFSEAKEVAEEMILDEESSKWPRTWYLRGQLCQVAYQEGMKKNDRKLYELYPDQLYVALESFQKAVSHDRSGKMERQVAPRYILLANDFQKLGEKYFTSKNYREALRAFEMALQISRNPMLEVETDMNLVYNTALAAYENRDWEKATNLFEKLHSNGWSVNATHLLFLANVEKGDTLAARKVLATGISKYDDRELLVLLLTDFLFNGNEAEEALMVIEQAILADSANFRYRYSKGLIHQKTGDYQEAILAYMNALQLAPEELVIYLNLATCYYNIGVEIEEKSRSLANNRLVREEKAKSEKAFESAAEWLEKALNKGTEDQMVMFRIHELYKSLQMTDRVRIPAPLTR